MFYPDALPVKTRDLRGEALHERILRGAAAAFGRLGYAATRVEDIVLETGISRPTFYKVFSDKDGAFAALLELHHRTIRERLAQAYESSAVPKTQLERAIESFLRWRAELGPVGRALDLEARSPNTQFANERKRMLEFVLELNQKGLACAGLSAVDPVLLRALVAGAENVADELFAKSPVSERTLQRAKEVVMRLQAGVLLSFAEPVGAVLVRAWAPAARSSGAKGPKRPTR